MLLPSIQNINNTGNFQVLSQMPPGKKTETPSYSSLNSNITKISQLVKDTIASSLTVTMDKSLALTKYFKFIPQNLCFCCSDFHDVIPKPTEKKNEISSDFPLYSNLTKIQKFMGGTIISFITLAQDESFTFLAKYFEFIPQDPCFFWNDYSGTIQKGLNFPVSQLNAWKATSFCAITFGGIGEELIFRKVLQDLLLTKLLGKAIKRVSPNHASWVDTKTAKIFRIVITSVLFAASHLIGMDKIPVGIKFQAFSALFNGFILGAIKESRLGLIGSIGCHMMHNTAASVGIYAMCLK